MWERCPAENRSGPMVPTTRCKGADYLNKYFLMRNLQVRRVDGLRTDFQEQSLGLSNSGALPAVSVASTTSIFRHLHRRNVLVQLEIEKWRSPLV